MKKRTRTRIVLAYEAYENALSYWDTQRKIKRYNKVSKKQGAHPLTMANYSERTLNFWR